jgi:hypothetical protein
MHQQTEFEPPTRAWAAKKFFSGLRRELGAAPNRKRPVLTDDLKQILAEIPDTAARETGPGAAAARVRGGVPPLGTGRIPCRGSRGQPGGLDHRDSQEQNGPGGRGQGSGHPARRRARNLPGPGAGRLARGGEDRNGAFVPGG